MRDADVTTEEVLEVFGDSIAGNHTVHLTLDDGAVLCSCVCEEFGGRVWFIGHDAALNDWDLVDGAEARRMIGNHLDVIDARRRQ